MGPRAGHDGRKKRGLSLAARVCLLVSGLILAVATVFCTVIWAAWQEESQSHVELIGGEIGRAVGGRIGESIVAGDGARIVRQLDAVSNVYGLRWALVSDLAGRRIATLGSLPADADRLSLRGVDGGVYKEPSAYVLVWPTRDAEGQVAGILRLGFDRAAIEAMRSDRFAQIALVVLAMIAACAPITLFVVSRLMAPLDKLTAYADSMTENDLAQRIEFNTNDEFATLAQAFNTMTGRLDAALQRMRRLAYIDPVTELPNAERFQMELAATLDALKGGDMIGAVSVISLDRIPRLTDTLGQEAAQELLALAGQRLAAAVRVADRTVRLADSESKPSLAARISNTEFAMIAPTLPTATDAARVAQIISSALSQPVGWRGHRITFGCTVGAALLPRDGSDADTALRHARLAVNAARGEQRPMRFFTRSLDNDAHARLTLEREMREGLDRSEFRAYFQPKIDFLSGKIIGAEALARWMRPDGSLVSPGVFIPAAEENGLIDAISDAIMRDACWKAAAWAREGFNINVAVNVSPLQFNDERFAQKIQRILDQSGMACELLELEVTESVAMKNLERVTSLIEPLRARGVRFAIDDFGTGHSSLAALTRLPFDLLKIDQQFVRGLSEDKHAPAIVETILAMAASLNFETVAEGVETEDQASFLRLRGCTIGQGYLFGPALPPADFLALVRSSIQPRDLGAARVA